MIGMSINTHVACTECMSSILAIGVLPEVALANFRSPSSPHQVRQGLRQIHSLSATSGAHAEVREIAPAHDRFL
jgi:hypothetical protein